MTVLTRLAESPFSVGDFMADAIIEKATTPTTYPVDAVVYSTVHRALMTWNGTQWRFAEAVPPYLWWDDCWGIVNSILSNALNSGTSAPNTTITTGHPGIQRWSSSASANSGGAYRLPSSSISTLLQAGMRCRIVFSPVSVAANIVQRVGMHNSINQTAPTDGAWLDVSAGTASFKTANGGATTTNATTAALSAGVWYTVHIWLPSATTARCIVMTDAGVTVLDVTNSANIPTGTTVTPCCTTAFFVTGGITALMDVDFVGIGYAPV